jgi:Rhs element Vgr protein
MPAPSPSLNAGGVVSVTVKADGSALADTAQLQRVQVHRSVNAIPWAVLELADGDLAAQDFALTDAATLAPGAEVEIELGYDSQTASVFKGVVVRFGSRFDEGGGTLRVECRDKAVAMTLGRRHRVFTDQKDSEVWSTLLGEHGLQAEVQATTVQHGILVQHDCSDWDFLLARAEANGCVVVVQDGKVTVQPPATEGEAVLTVTLGVDLMSFSAETDARSQAASAVARGWDPATQAKVESEAPPDDRGLQGDLRGATLAGVFDSAVCELRSTAQHSTEVLSAWAKAQQTKAALARVRGRARMQGSALAQAGALLALEGVSSRFAGKVYMGELVHRVHDGDWHTEVGFGLDPAWRVTREDVAAPRAGALLPGVSGLQVGVVTKLDEDPDGAHRIQVRTPALEADADPVWARLLMPYASNGFGLLLLPEIGDEVLVGHLADDPVHPVVLGAMYSGQHAPPEALEAENKLKLLTTRCGHRLCFDDDKKIVTLKTPAGNTLVLDDDQKKITLEDQTGNKMVLSDSGILIESPKDITLKATGEIKLQSTGKMSLKSQADVGVEGLNVEAKAQVGLTAKGTATAELSASGQTTVKGAMVMIN